MDSAYSPKTPSQSNDLTDSANTSNAVTNANPLSSCPSARALFYCLLGYGTGSSSGSAVITRAIPGNSNQPVTHIFQSMQNQQNGQSNDSNSSNDSLHYQLLTWPSISSSTASVAAVPTAETHFIALVGHIDNFICRIHGVPMVMLAEWKWSKKELLAAMHAEFSKKYGHGQGKEAAKLLASVSSIKFLIDKGVILWPVRSVDLPSVVNASAAGAVGQEDSQSIAQFIQYKPTPEMTTAGASGSVEDAIYGLPQLAVLLDRPRQNSMSAQQSSSYERQSQMYIR